MVINYDIEKINKSLQDFYNSTGINMALMKSDFSYVCEDRTHWGKNRYCKAIQNTSEGKRMCVKSDKELLKRCSETKSIETHICPGGLVDVALPILYEDEIIGYIMFGQLKPDVNFKEFESYILKLGLDIKDMSGYYAEIPYFDSEKIKSVSSIASMFVKYILLENLLKAKLDDKTQTVVSYIDQNLDKNLTVKEISKGVNLSKSVLYRLFHEKFNCTLSEYINKKRVEKSLSLLEDSDLSVEEISQRVGFSSVSYYGQVFKKLKNTTPLKYKKHS
ncbi:MAG: PocR ligand-binding domain-containing protein [Clostridia bacterium]|nr:PocR ligand-binding domain-containing protein [Clostridia bacterium]